MNVEGAQLVNEPPKGFGQKKKKEEEGGDFYQVFLICNETNVEERPTGEVESSNEESLEFISPLIRVIDLSNIEIGTVGMKSSETFVPSSPGFNELTDVKQSILGFRKCDVVNTEARDTLIMDTDSMPLRDTTLLREKFFQTMKDVQTDYGDISKAKEDLSPKMNSQKSPISRMEEVLDEKENLEIFDLKENKLPEVVTQLSSKEIMRHESDENISKNQGVPGLIKKRNVDSPNYERVIETIPEFKIIDSHLNVEPVNENMMSENLKRISDSIIKSMETIAEPGKSIMKVKLIPEELGSVDITLKVEGGRLSANITVESSHVKQMLTDRLNELNSNLIRQNLNIGEIHIDLSGSSNQRFGQNNKYHYKGVEIFRSDNNPINILNVEESYMGNGMISVLA